MELKNDSGIILGEAENVVEGVPGRFSLNLNPGAYASTARTDPQEDQGKLVATGTAVSQAKGASAPLLGKATVRYKAYVIAETAQLQSDTKKFVAALRSGDVAKAKALFGPARLHYEAIEPVAESLRQPRSRYRRTHQRRVEREAVDGLSPHRANAVAAEHDEGHGRLRDQADGRRQHAGREGEDDPAPARPARQRRGRTDERGRELEDHGRGGPLLAH